MLSRCPGLGLASESLEFHRGLPEKWLSRSHEAKSYPWKLNPPTYEVLSSGALGSPRVTRT